MALFLCYFFFFFSSRRRHTRCSRDWSSDVCSSDLYRVGYDLVPRLRNRLQRVAVDLPVEREHRRVKGLPRVVILSNGLLSGLGRAQWTFCRIRGGPRQTFRPFGCLGGWGRRQGRIVDG